MIQSLLDFLQRHTYLLYAGLLLLTVVTLSVTLLPSDRIPSDIQLFQYDKVGHTLLFGSWTFLLGLTRFVTTQKELPLLILFISGGLFGISIEILQELLPIDRFADPEDVIADLVGCLGAVLLLKYMTGRSLNEKMRGVKSP